MKNKKLTSKQIRELIVKRQDELIELAKGEMTTWFYYDADNSMDDIKRYKTRFDELDLLIEEMNRLEGVEE